jgi:hypothetical protein
MTTKQSANKQNQALINLTNDKKFDELAAYVTELVQGYQRAGQAINRLERFQFSLIKVILDKGLMTYGELVSAMQQLDGAEDIEVYWGVKGAYETAPETVNTDGIAEG